MPTHLKRKAHNERRPRLKSTLQTIPIFSILIKPQVRENIEEKDQLSLTQSIEHNGVLVPLLGHLESSKIVLDDGHRRLDAAKRAGLDTIPIIVSDHSLSQADRITFQLLANAHRRDLQLTEHARAIQQLMQETGKSAVEISIMLGGPSPSTISKLLAILVLPRQVQSMVDCGKLPMSSAYTIATVNDSAERQRLVDEVLAGRMTRDRLVKHVKSNRSGKKSSSSPRRKRTPKQRITISLGQGRSVVVSAPSLSSDQVANWLITLAGNIKQQSKDGRSIEEVIKLVAEMNKKSSEDDPSRDPEEI